jgi:hypothetical protein
MYTNEAGFDVFQTALKQDALNSGLTFTADSGNRFMQGSDSTSLTTLHLMQWLHVRLVV